VIVLAVNNKNRSFVAIRWGDDQSKQGRNGLSYRCTAKNLMIKFNERDKQTRAGLLSDITYIINRKRPCYPSLVTDAYSKKIMSFYIADNLNMKNNLIELEMTVKSKTDKGLSGMHLLDRGFKYCADGYQKTSKKI
jgi:hypothetical protein